jgi:membrane-associated phospholipid phosphatase
MKLRNAGFLLLATTTMFAQEEREVSLKTIGPNILHDQVSIWTFPAKVAKGRHLLPTVAVLGVTGGLIVSDPYTGKFFRRHEDSFSGLNEHLTESVGTAGSLGTPAVFYLTGLIRKDRYMQNTGLLAAQAWVGAEIPNLALRAAFRRSRPLDFEPDGSFRGTWFKTKGSPFAAKGGFPSGHTATAFAVATVVARRYGHQHRWVPFVAYGLASTVAFSRATSGNHFLGDIFLGGAIGYSVGRFVVLRD